MTLERLVQFQSERTSNVEREDLKRQWLTLETTIQEHLTLAKKQQDEGQQRLTELHEQSEDEDDALAQRALAIKEIEEQARLLEADQVSCGVLYSQARAHRTQQEISKVITDDNSKAFVGLPKSVIGKINQRIGEVTTQRGSTAVVGVFQDYINMANV